MLFVAVLTAGLVGAPELAQAAPRLAAVDSYCTQRHVSWNDGFSTYWTAEGIGYVNWRLSGDLTIYDKCDHGGISGYISINRQALQAKGMGFGLRFWYQTPGSRGWTSAGLTFTNVTASPNQAWVTYRVSTSHIDLYRTWQITPVRMGSYLTYAGVSGAPRHEQCAAGSRCEGGIGL